jgi:uncharacterized membrane protein YraQ (UPF0718 family)
MMVIKEKIKNNKLLSLVLLVYIVLAVVAMDKALQSLNNSIYYVKEMLQIMPVILLLTSLIEAWVPQKAIKNNLGKNAGFKGAIFSFLLGSFSAGPIYAAFPVCKMLLKKGASISNIVIILSTWAVVKVPMLANEAKFLGPKFMAIRWVLTTGSIFLMAYIAAKVIKKEEIPMEDININRVDNRLLIDERYCIGCGLCVKLSPNNFVIKNKKAKFTGKDNDYEKDITIKEAADKCPAKAIQSL